MSENIQTGVALPESACELLSIKFIHEESANDHSSNHADIGASAVLNLAELQIPQESKESVTSNPLQETKEETVLLQLADLKIPAELKEDEEEPVETDKLLCLNDIQSAEEEHTTHTIENDHHLETAYRANKRRGSTIDVVNCDETTESSDAGSIDNVLLAPPFKETELANDAVIPVGEEDSELFDFREMAAGAMRQAEELVRKMLMHVSWTICHFHALPRWLQDNDFIWQGYRPPLPSFWDCIKSIFSIHTETGNIWTHMLGCIAFVGVASFFLSSNEEEIRGEDKMVFTAFFVGAVVCLGLSTCFHTFLCHSEWAGQLFSKLDYVGIALLIMGSFVPWLYYSFYCDFFPRITYLCVEIVLGLTSIIISLWPRFGEPKYRFLRAGVFLSFGLSGVVPAVHYSVQEGWIKALDQASLGWLILMGMLYIIGTMFYALRIPERFFPGKFDIWFQSHQIFHVFVVAAAFVHYHGISEMAMHRLTIGECMPPPLENLSV